jgi:hypothetical protein
VNGYLDETRVQFLDAADQQPVDPVEEIGGIPVAGLRDLLATKLKVVGDPGELRDYLDLMILERDAGHRVEEGLALFINRYRPATPGGGDASHRARPRLFRGCLRRPCPPG